jgi:hypothetical protein
MKTLRYKHVAGVLWKNIPTHGNEETTWTIGDIFYSARNVRRNRTEDFAIEFERDGKTERVIIDSETELKTLKELV